MSGNLAEKNILFAGGGTGGHLYPSIAIAQALQEMDESINIHFAGTNRGLENRIIPEMGYPLHLIAVRGFSRKNPLLNIWIVMLLLYSLAQCLVLLLRLRPAAVVGTGGYVSGPVLFLAAMLGIPTLVQEQNSHPGVTTRMLAKFVDQVHLSFEESAGYFKNSKKVHVTGNPVRRFDMSNNRENARVFFNLSPDRPTVLVFGGSQGAVAINKAFRTSLPRLIAETDAQFIWITGSTSYESFKKDAKGFNGRLHIVEYVNNMNIAYQASNLAVCRAGAIAISELAICGLPAILVPFPYATADHQTVNAQSYAKTGAARVITESELNRNQDLLANSIIELINGPEKREKMSASAKNASFPNAVDTLARSVLNIMKKQSGRHYGFFIPRQKNIIF